MTRIHIVSLPHTLLTKSYVWCAYTAKVMRFVDMLVMGEHTPIVYGPDIADLPAGVEHVPIVHEADRHTWFGASEWDANRVFDRWDPADPCWVTSNQRAAAAIRERWAPGDVLGLIAGRCQQQIVTDLVDLAPLVTEWGIGYSGVLEGTHKVFESYAWMHHVAALRPTDDLHFYDAVIPNCFDPGDYQFSAEPGSYLLYLGRPTMRKGLAIVAEIAARTDLPLLVAGQPGVDIPGATHVGLVTGEVKAQLLAGARAVLCPTVYVEPFGGVAVEAMLSGTPVIATDYGAFTETVQEGISGFRCRMLRDFMAAIGDCETLDRHAVREHAMARYTTDVGSVLYGRYFERIDTLFGAGWYAGA